MQGYKIKQLRKDYQLKATIDSLAIRSDFVVEKAVLTLRIGQHLSVSDELTKGTRDFLIGINAEFIKENESIGVYVDSIAKMHKK